MPIVGSKHFPYSPKGIQAAKAAAKQSGKSMVSKPPIKKR